MDLRQLRYFVAVAEEANIGRAAARLHISQPPLTRQIQQLEADLGVVLFNRTPKGMELTPAGELFLDEARNIQALVEQATERTQRAGQGRLGRLDVAIFGSAILDVIPEVLLEFRTRYPDVNVVLHTMTKAEQMEALRQKRINVAFNRILEPQPDLEMHLVTAQRIMLAVPAHHPLAQQDVVPFPQIAPYPLVVFPTGTRPSFIDRLMSMCAKAGFQPNVSQAVGDTVNAVALVACGFGICVVPSSASTLRVPGVVYRPLSEVPDGGCVDLTCFHRAGDTSPILAGLLQIVDAYRERTAAPG
ncbi:LysR family transcriptional regulator [Nitrogeniibacter mangrovi]|uniref:LysR family transcriptional regulator n=1 Tax=Nitrogeniibacter mangrovi TaxID=2016596 RepID=A0A6C1AZQ5_9RHOO|nr:LysR family transcriptional regulator [Nitrogeniibacter mangrovi]QID16219.1 LysR family transcriptional regulator [Nitrogeniibacter mangrovi]